MFFFTNWPLYKQNNDNGNDETANSYKVNACNKVLFKISKTNISNRDWLN